ncbi:MAG: glycosyltransferase [Rhizobiaceae bacterium]|nr:glycosyltransferase [Rhizobiaceae bacterium]
MIKIAFYATIKPPDHHIASGDRLVARNLMAALSLAGYEVELASRFIAYSKREAREILEQRKSEALAEADRLIDALRLDPPEIWMTYHPYCKAPDWIGPKVSAALGIPYVTVEAARTGQGFENGGDRWADWRLEAQSGILQADLNLVFKPTDRAYLVDLLGSADRISMIAPFIDATAPSDLPKISLPSHWRPGAPVILTVGMMRPGKKVENFKLLASALKQLQALHWNLVVVGSGPQKDTIHGFFSEIDKDRLHFAGVLSHEEVLAMMSAVDLFVWPGWKEPIGMVYLEAQLMGLPVAAFDSMGVSLSVYHGKTGLLAAEDDLSSFVDNLSSLISHPLLRRDFGHAAQQSIVEHHSMQAAAKTLKKALNELVDC